MTKRAILLVNLGGPDSLDAVRPFLYQLFSDPDIFQFPMGFITQKLFAWMVSSRRYKAAQENYQAIGGRSPILPLTQAQADALASVLHTTPGYEGVKVYVAMRYWHPFTAEVVAQMAQDGIEDILMLPLYPQFSFTTTGSSLNELKRCLKKVPHFTPRIRVVGHYYQHPSYLAALAETIQEGLSRGQWSVPEKDVRILFSAHSLPRSFISKRKDPYQRHIETTCQAVMHHAFPEHTWDLAYQSKVGKLVWLGPQTDGMLAYYRAKEIDNILIVPVAFVSDHVETLCEIDQEYIPEAHHLGLCHVERCPSLNSRPTFIHALKTILMEKDVKQGIFPTSSDTFIPQAATPHAHPALTPSTV
ncbi:MAG: ferrochelatase [Vampirovibrionales bacterium]